MCNFEIEFSGSADELFNKLKAGISKANGVFDGNASSGSFDISVMGAHIVGQYTIAGHLLKTVITEKPFLVSCGQIQNLVRQQL